VRILSDTTGANVKAIIATRAGGPEVLETVEVDDPVPGPDELLVRVHATALNRADLLQRAGGYPPPPGASDVIGLEMAGAVAEIGESVSGFAVGDRVCAVLTAGGHAEFVVVPSSHALPIPASLDWTQAAAVPEVFSTAWDNVFTRGRLHGGETLLVHGGSSGVGTATIQLAVRAGARVAVTASTPQKLKRCAELGAERLINYSDSDFVAETKEWTGGRGVDVILDMVGAAYLERNVEALATEGRLVVIGLQQGSEATLDMRRMMTRRLSLTGSTLRARSNEDKAVVAAAVRAHVLPGLDDGSLRPVIDRVLPWDRVQEAHRAMETGGHIGKIVLTVT
jgi:putative PIG3 family NAD(P)H quinone oxidoreductase